MEKLIIIGSGPAGLTAAIYSARADLGPIVLEGDTPGGQLLWTTQVENFPGFDQGVLGPALMQKMQKQAKQFGAKLVSEIVQSVDFKYRPFKVVTLAKTYQAEAIIVASGARPRMLGLKNEKKFLGKGIHTCATCDGAFYRGKEVIVIGGGDSAVEEATFITKFAKKVYLIHRKDSFSASDIMQKRALGDSKIEFVWNSEITAYLGQERLESVELLNRQTGQKTVRKIDGLFLAVGHIPNTEPFLGQLKFAKHDYLEVSNQVFSDVPGVFVAGDVADWRYRQAVTAAGLGCMAALEAEKYLAGLAKDMP
ncbi:MAG: Thioredoxin reductase [Parcubacteria group bacterium GW2011_GWF2_45_11]|nr:MAG: Thioredoxin reductase [Parcubacteria group bacterium GW2011_GWF2_45_11]KKT98020.1 MAG: Thioredoxin reductase [Parcubacteria group bacterium GW2011_GWC2_45_15]